MSSKGIAGFNTGLVRSIENGYSPTEWSTGDVITADKLNNIEQGVDDNNNSVENLNDNVGSIFTVRLSNINNENATIDRTFAEIAEAINKGLFIVVDAVGSAGNTYSAVMTVPDSTHFVFSATGFNIAVSGTSCTINNARYLLTLTSAGIDSLEKETWAVSGSNYNKETLI